MNRSRGQVGAMRAHAASIALETQAGTLFASDSGRGWLGEDVASSCSIGLGLHVAQQG